MHGLYNHFTRMCSGSEAGSFLRLIGFVHHSTLGLRVIKKKNNNHSIHIPIVQRSKIMEDEVVGASNNPEPSRAYLPFLHIPFASRLPFRIFY